MFNNFQQPPAYGPPPFDTYGQSTYPNQYEQIPYSTQQSQSQPIYDSSPSAPPPFPGGPMQQQYASQPIYDSSPSAPPPFPGGPMQQQYASQPQFGDNTYMNPQPIYQAAPQQPIYQAPPQQPPPTYAAAVQSPPYTAPVQQQQQQQQQQPPKTNNPNLPPSYGTAPGTPFSQGYKWPRKSIPVVCPVCGASVTTRVDNSITFITIIGAIILFFFTCILACLPFCIPTCKKTTHYCPYCNSVLGIRKELR